MSLLFYALLSLPSPPTPVAFEAGPLTVRYYGLCIVLGIIVGTWLTGRQLASRGYDGALALESLFFVVPLGVVGSRLYYVATEYGVAYLHGKSIRERAQALIEIADPRFRDALHEQARAAQYL